NEKFQKVNWKQLFNLCAEDGDEDGAKFMELMRLTSLQLALIYCPRKRIPEKPVNGTKKKKPVNKQKQVLKRKKRKLKAQLRALQEHQPESPKIKELSDSISLLCIDIRDAINLELNRKELKAVATVKKNPRFFFSYAKKHSKLRSNVGPLKDSTNTLQTDPKVMADILQQQYVSVFTDPANPAIRDTTAKLQQPNCKIEDMEFSLEDVVKAIDEIDTYSSTSHECIPACILKACKQNLSIPIHMLWDQSFSNGRIPDSLKEQFITPIHKKDSKADPANYRPVSLTSHVIKVFERIIRNNLVEYMEGNFLLSNKQHGFRRGRSCLTQLLAHYDSIIRNLNSGLETDVIYLDFSKAFDKVDHGLLLRKLKFYGIKGKLFTWIKEFLTNRKQIVTVDGVHSEPADVTSGVPQGTVLGPLLFLLDINDLEEVVQSAKVACFADDTRLSAPIDCEGDTLLLQNDLNRVVEWSIQNNMVLHEGKFEYLCYRTGDSKWLEEMPFTNSHMEYKTPAGFTICPKDSVKDLGVTLSADYHWSIHINQMAAGARRLASWALGVFRDRSTTVMMTIWKALIRCKLEYCCPLWHPHKLEDIKALEDVQRFFTRQIAGMQDADYWERLKRLKIQSLQRRRERYIIIHVWKLLHKMVPNDLNVEFYHRERLGWRARIPKFFSRARQSSKTLYDASFAVNGPKLWNTLPKSINSIQDLDTFKIHLGKFLEAIPDNPPTTGYTTANANSMLNWFNQPGGLREKL
ncbi:MAG: reverse transcriptase family protein, partial [Gammaproteobacteria bacterium]|nr:reverse transcriptase family protein [Gammaproteobacteria bacterium]